jgi:CDGSH-type Zn-finger protein
MANQWITCEDMKMDKPEIVFTKYLPYQVIDLKNIENSKGEQLSTKTVTALCRCGHSDNKPYCDGSHSMVGFVGNKDPERVPDKIVEFRGKDITIVDNRGVCAHKGACTDNLPKVFIPYDVRGDKPWIDPNAATVREIIETIEKCPSGALSYKLNKKRYQDLDRKPKITVSKDGPLEVVGYIKIKDDMDSTPESEEHYCLCRCGESLNRPFCDGAHHDIEFKDEKN